MSTKPKRTAAVKPASARAAPSKASRAAPSKAPRAAPSKVQRAAPSKVQRAAASKTPRVAAGKAPAMAPGTAALVLGDQLWAGNPALAAIERGRNPVLMIEAPGESTHVWSHKARTSLFLSAMRHFAADIAKAGHALRYIRLADRKENDYGDRLFAELKAAKIKRLLVTEPGDHRLLLAIHDACKRSGTALEILTDTHFIVDTPTFQRWAGDRPHLLMENFYREMRRKTGILMQGAEPAGGVWNFDKSNRDGFPSIGPGSIPLPKKFKPDAITREVIKEVTARFHDHPGELSSFDWPVTRADALEALDDFVRHRLVTFGRYQDAMWTGTPFAWHSRLSAALNLHLLDPREVIAAALVRLNEHRLPLPDVEGFVRQILGWREFVRGIYWLDMPKLEKLNHLKHTRALPAWYWTGKTGMACMQDTVGQTLKHGYAHHIQRLMVTGNFGLIAGLDPSQVCDWYLAVYVDAVDWVERPNTAGMALYATGPRFTSKPYAASGAYIRRMSNYCEGCRYKSDIRSGENACPFNVFYWDFLDRNEKMLSGNPRTALMVKNLERLTADERRAIREQAKRYASNLDAL